MGRSIRLIAAVFALLATSPAGARAACCYFSAKNADILQPAQKVFITWDPKAKIETFKFEGNSLDFGMVIPTPRLHEMPRDFFKHLAVYMIIKSRAFPSSKYVALDIGTVQIFSGAGSTAQLAAPNGIAFPAKPKPAVVVLETGVVGSLDYKVIEATRADDLFAWLKDNKYSYSGDEATLQHYKPAP